MKKRFAELAATVAYFAVLVAGFVGLPWVIIVAAYPVDFVAIPAAIETGESSVVLAAFGVGGAFVLVAIYAYGRAVFWFADWLSRRVQRWLGGPDSD